MVRFFSCLPIPGRAKGRHDLQQYDREQMTDRLAHYYFVRSENNPKIPRQFFFLLNSMYAAEGQLGSYYQIVQHFVLQLINQVRKRLNFVNLQKDTNFMN